MTSSANILKIGWGTGFLAYGMIAAWLLSHPASIPSDDAFFFASGIERFSILEFRPHFPGYPGFIALGKLLHLLGLPPKESVFYLSLAAALFLPLLVTWTATGHGASQWGVLLAFWATLSQPFLPLVGLSMLSDSCGIAFLVLGLGLVSRKRWGWSGAALGMSLACRPSFLLPVAVAVAVVFIKQRKQAFPILISGIGVAAVFFLAIVLLEGRPYFVEAWRFTEGHFLLWGNSSFSEATGRPGWIAGLAGEKPVAVTMVILLAGLGATLWEKREITTLVATTLTAILWTFLAQNPDNLRHLLLPGILIVLVIICHASFCLRVVLTGAVLIQSAIIVSSMDFRAVPSALERMTQALSTETVALVVSNHGLAYLRDRLPHLRIADTYYRYSSGSLTKRADSQHSYRVSTSSPPEGYASFKSFSGRVPGEKNFVIYRGN